MDAPLEIFLLAGQSNMAGRGCLDGEPSLEHPDILVFRDDRWQVAREPLHGDKPTAGAGLAMSFARDLVSRRPGTRVGLVPAAVGGTPLCRWQPGADLYENALAAALRARGAGEIKGILWHQGEADSQRVEDADSYGERLAAMIAALRSALGGPEIPFVAGELGPFLREHSGCRFFRVVNRQLRALDGSVPRAACASARGLADIGDHVHFNTASLRLFGRRYATAYCLAAKVRGISNPVAPGIEGV